MAERDLWDLLQPSWVDKMGATAWDPPNLPLFEGAPWPAAGPALANGAGQTAQLIDSSGFPYPLPPGWPNFIPGPATPSQVADPEIWAQIINALSRPPSVRSTGISTVLPTAADSFDDSSAAYVARPSRAGGSSSESQFELAQVQQPAANVTVAAAAGSPTKVPLPRRRPPGAPQLPPVGMSQETPWLPKVSGFTPAEDDRSFDARWNAQAEFGGGLDRLLELSSVPSPISQHKPALSASGTVDAQYIYSYLLDKGLSIPQAAALVGNIIHESRLDPNLLTPGENSHGLVQWRLDRWPNLQKFAAARGTPPNDVNTQLDFIFHEMNGSERHNVQDFLVANDVESANDALENYFRYSDKKSKPQRLTNAFQVMQLPWSKRK